MFNKNKKILEKECIHCSSDLIQKEILEKNGCSFKKGKFKCKKCKRFYIVSFGIMSIEPCRE